jgi:gamma-glutamyltranspeptidase/glutathione hydrolase
MRILFSTCVLIACSLPVQAAVVAPLTATQGMVASDHALASEAGAAVLKAGGNAFDAAIATSLVLSVVRPQSTGIGGGGFMVLRTASGQAQVIDYREVAPAKASRDMYLAPGLPKDASTQGYLAVAVPGMMAGLGHIAKQYATRPLPELMAPAIRAAEKGFAADAHFVEATRAVAERGMRPELKRLFLCNDQPCALGTPIRNPELGQTLRRMAEHGVQDFYTGDTAKKIVAAMEVEGGLVSASDLTRYTPKLREPLRGTYRGYDILTMPPPSSGGTVLLQALNFLEAYPLGWATTGFGSSQHIHLLTEALKHGFADRAALLGDPDFVTIPLAKLISKGYAAELRQRFDPARTLPRTAYGMAGFSSSTAPDAGTTHFSIMDRFGNVVAATETINTYFGSQVVVPGTGIVLNNEMDDFSKQPGVPNAFGLIGGEANAIAPGKKPLSSMTPTIVLKGGKPFMAVGASGGPRIITGTLQTLMNVIDFDMSAEAAVSMPRIHHQWMPEKLFIEREMPQDVRQVLAAKGHSLALGGAENVVQAVVVREGHFEGASDPRKGGRPAGY